MSDFMTPKEFANMLCLHVNTVYQMVEDKKIPYVRTNIDSGKILIPKKWVEEKFGSMVGE